jgi:IclR family acetate operon transcriptional repressor
MQDLHATTGLPIHLGIPDEDRVTIVESLRSQEPGPERPAIGQSDPMHSFAVGLALLAFSAPDFRERYVSGLEERENADTVERIRSEILRARADGYATSQRRTRPRTAIGAPVFDREGLPMGALSVVAPEEAATPPYGHLVQSTARGIQRTAWDQGIG